MDSGKCIHFWPHWVSTQLEPKCGHYWPPWLSTKIWSKTLNWEGGQKGWHFFIPWCWRLPQSPSNDLRTRASVWHLEKEAKENNFLVQVKKLFSQCWSKECLDNKCLALNLTLVIALIVLYKGLIINCEWTWLKRFLK